MRQLTHLSCPPGLHYNPRSGLYEPDRRSWPPNSARGLRGILGFAIPSAGSSDTGHVSVLVRSGAAVSGTMQTDIVSESDIVDGGKSIIVALSGDTYDATLGADNAVSTAFINGFTSLQSEPNGWNNVVKAGLNYTHVTRNTATQATLGPLPAFGSYDITATEEIECRLAASVLVTSDQDVVATPSFGVGVLSEGQPVYSAGSHDLIFDDDLDSFVAFNNTNGSPAFRDRYPNGHVNAQGFTSANADDAEDTGLITMVTGRGGSGKAIRLLLGNGGSWETNVGPIAADLNQVGELDGSLPEVVEPYESFYCSCWFRTSVGANPAAANSAGVKGFQYSAGWPNRLEWRPCKLRYGGDRWNSPRWTRGGGIDSNDVTGVDYWKTVDGYPPLWTQNDGNWHEIFTEIHAGAGVSNANRGQKVWLDKALIYDDIGRLPKLFDMFGYGVGQDWRNQACTGGFRWTATPPIDGFRVWGTFVSPTARDNTPQFTIDFDDPKAWADK